MAFIPLNQPSDVAILSLINRDNPPPPGRLKLTLDNVSFSDLRAGEHPARNTSLTVIAKPGFDHVNQQVIHYNRLDISRFAINGTRQMDGYYFTTDQLLPELNENFGLGLISDEVVDAEVLDNDTIVLKISNSYVYQPGTELVIKEGFFDLVARMESLTTGGLLSIGTAPLPVYGA